MSPALKLVGPKPGLAHYPEYVYCDDQTRAIVLCRYLANLDPDVQTLIETTLLAPEEVKKFNIEPVIAMVSYSNFGSVKSSEHTRTDRLWQTIATCTCIILI